MMFAVPAFTPVTSPLFGSTTAALVLSLLHVPPPVPFVVNGVAEPAHIAGAPLTVPAIATVFTVINVCVLGLPQPVAV